MEQIVLLSEGLIITFLPASIGRCIFIGMKNNKKIASLSRLFPDVVIFVPEIKKIMKLRYFPAVLLMVLFVLNAVQKVYAQAEAITVEIKTDEQYQTIKGFGASLAYYENWLTAHPNRSEIYNVIFSELSLDILRVRNAYGYDEGMVGRVKQFAAAAESSLGHPIDILVTSWGPPASLKSNNDKINGGTLKYTVSDGKVNFDYDAFARWWDESLDEYNANGIYPRYISIQNEPDFKASWESCLFNPSEKINSTDTIAGYNMALEAVYDTVMKREHSPVFLGPETIGIGFNAVENYINALDLSKLYGIAHHLYHGAEGGTVENDPFTSSNYKKVGSFHPEVPHFQTEYSREGWFTLSGMIFQSLVQENAAAFLYWDLIWSEGGLVNLDFPWDRSRWVNPKGYNRTKDYYVFKHYSAFIHPGWKRTGTSPDNNLLKTAAFMNLAGDSATCIVVNRSSSDSFSVHLQIPGYSITDANVYTTTEDSNFVSTEIPDTVIQIPPRSLTTVDLRLASVTSGVSQHGIQKQAFTAQIFPNPISGMGYLRLDSDVSSRYQIELFDFSGIRVHHRDLGFYSAGEHRIQLVRFTLEDGTYIYRITDAEGKTVQGKLAVKN